MSRKPLVVSKAARGPRPVTIAFVLVSACAYEPGQVLTDDDDGSDAGDMGSGSDSEPEQAEEAVAEESQH